MSRTLFSCLQEKVQENRGVSGLAFLLRGHGSVLVGLRSIRFDQGPKPEFLLHLLQSFVCAELLQACRHRRAPVSDGCPSACHGYAVACIGQPPPPSAPGPVWGWRAGLLSRGCGGRAAGSRRGAGVRPKIASRGCAGVDRLGTYLAALVIKLLGPSGWLRFGQIACPTTAPLAH
jgi:hypothetical protein